MVCSSKDCFWVKKHGYCFYDGLMPSNHPKTHEECEYFKFYAQPVKKPERKLSAWEKRWIRWVKKNER